MESESARSFPSPSPFPPSPSHSMTETETSETFPSSSQNIHPSPASPPSEISFILSLYQLESLLSTVDFTNSHDVTKCSQMVENHIECYRKITFKRFDKDNIRLRLMELKRNQLILMEKYQIFEHKKQREERAKNKKYSLETKRKSKGITNDKTIGNDKGNVIGKSNKIMKLRKGNEESKENFTGFEEEETEDNHSEENQNGNANEHFNEHFDGENDDNDIEDDNENDNDHDAHDSSSHHQRNNPHPHPPHHRDEKQQDADNDDSQQSSLTDLLSLSVSLKERTLSLRSALHEDKKVLNSSSNQLDSTLDRVKDSTSSLKRWSSTSCSENCAIITLCVVISVIFFCMVIFMKIVPKPAH